MVVYDVSADIFNAHYTSEVSVACNFSKLQSPSPLICFQPIQFVTTTVVILYVRAELYHFIFNHVYIIPWWQRKMKSAPVSDNCLIMSEETMNC